MTCVRSHNIIHPLHCSFVIATHRSDTTFRFFILASHILNIIICHYCSKIFRFVINANPHTIRISHAKIFASIASPSIIVHVSHHQILKIFFVCFSTSVIDFIYELVCINFIVEFSAVNPVSISCIEYRNHRVSPYRASLSPLFYLITPIGYGFFRSSLTVAPLLRVGF